MLNDSSSGIEDVMPNQIVPQSLMKRSHTGYAFSQERGNDPSHEKAANLNANREIVQQEA
jgi:hypothetical protein